MLTSLAGGAKHGYAITQDVQKQSGVRLGPGTLYGIIARLEERGWIKPLPAEDRRRPYELTGTGASALQEQLAGMQKVSKLGLARLNALRTTT